jgi:hypothetical protein
VERMRPCVHVRRRGGARSRRPSHLPPAIRVPEGAAPSNPSQPGVCSLSTSPVTSRVGRR